VCHYIYVGTYVATSYIIKQTVVLVGENDHLLDPNNRNFNYMKRFIKQ